MSKFISVITPTYNRGHLIEKALNSVLDQSFQDFELIIVDDASTDNTSEVVKKFNDDRIRYFRYEKNGGNAVARNVGVKEAKGDYIAFLDSDDVYHSDYLDHAVNLLQAAQAEKADVAFLWSGTRTVSLDGTFTDSIWVPNTEQEPNQFLYELHVGIGRGFLIDKRCFEKVNFDERLRTAVDTDFLIRLRQNFNYTVLDEILLSINTQPGSVRSDYSEKKKSYEIIISKHKDVILGDDYLRFKWFYKLFWLSLYDGDWSLAKTAYSHIKYEGIKPTLLLFFFKFLPRKQAINLHRKLSS